MITDILRVILYLALAASIGMYAWRLYRHIVHHETRHDRAERRRAAAAADANAGPDARATPTPIPGVDTGIGTGPTESGRRGPAKSTPTPTGPIEDGALVRDVIRQELAKKQAAEGGPAALSPAAGAADAGGRTGMFAKPQRPVAELLAGIALPCDLAPLVDRDELDPNRVVFATAGHVPATVARALADELERLGFRVDTVSDHEAVARKADGDLHLTIHDDMGTFPSAPRGGVVVELHVLTSALPIGPGADANPVA